MSWEQCLSPYQLKYTDPPRETLSLSYPSPRCYPLRVPTAGNSSLGSANLHQLHPQPHHGQVLITWGWRGLSSTCGQYHTAVHLRLGNFTAAPPLETSIPPGNTCLPPSQPAPSIPEVFYSLREAAQATCKTDVPIALPPTAAFQEKPWFAKQDFLPKTLSKEQGGKKERKKNQPI